MALTSIAGAQQLQQFAKTGLVNLSKIYAKFYSQSQAVRDFEQLKASIQSDINKSQNEIRALMDQKTNAQNQGDLNQAQNLDNEIRQKTAALKDFVAVKQAELQKKSEEVRKDDSFQKLLLSEIEQEAVSKGFSLILNIDKDSSVVWYSPDADITDGVIARLQVDLAATNPVPPQAPVTTPPVKP
jgi:Skp family chaperone for outer membrane proteins